MFCGRQMPHTVLYNRANFGVKFLSLLNSMQHFLGGGISFSIVCMFNFCMVKLLSDLL